MDSNIFLLTKNLPLAAPMEYGSPSIDKKKSSKSEATVRIPTTNQVKTSEESAVIPNDGNCTSRVEVNRTECTSAVTGSVSSLEKDFHVVKIKVSSDQKHKIKIGEGQGPILVASDVPLNSAQIQSESEGLLKKPKVTVVSLKPDTNNSEQYSSIESYSDNSAQSFSTFITDSQNLKTTTILNSSSEMVQKPNGELEVNNPTYLFYMMTSGQCSPSDTLDSGTCSDLENGHGNTANNNNSTTPPPLPKKVGPRLKMHLQNTKIVTQDQGSNSINSASQNSPQHIRTGSFTDSEESESSLSCDSLNSSEFAGNSLLSNIPSPPPPLLTSKDLNPKGRNLSFLPDSLLRDIRDRKFIVNNKDVVDCAPRETTTATYRNGVIEAPKVISKVVNISSAKDRARDKNKTRVLITRDDIDDDLEKPTRSFENDKFYTFHLNEKDVQDLVEQEPKIIDDESFAGFKDIHSGTSTIRSSKGTVRGVKNRVRNGIATFLQMQQSNVKNYKEKDSGKVVLYTTSMGIVRETYAKCSNVKQILRTLLVKFEERDVFMSSEYQQEIKERMQYDEINVPQLFVEGQHIGDAEAVERLNETGELRKILKPYKSMNASYTCQVCGGYRLLPCSSCNGSKKSVHRNHFTTEFVALKCMNCDEVGLVKCHNC